MDSHCTIETFRFCESNSDCPAPGDSCGGPSSSRECFAGNGIVGSSVSVAGYVGVPGGTSYSAALGAFACMAPTSSAAVNAVFGFPGLARLTVPMTATFNQ
jgi:hypothetical protein